MQVQLKPAIIARNEQQYSLTETSSLPAVEFMLLDYNSHMYTSFPLPQETLCSINRQMAIKTASK
jgi:hypothetical protein